MFCVSGLIFICFIEFSLLEVFLFINHLNLRDSIRWSHPLFHLQMSSFFLMTDATLVELPQLLVTGGASISQMAYDECTCHLEEQLDVCYLQPLRDCSS